MRTTSPKITRLLIVLACAGALALAAGCSSDDDGTKADSGMQPDSGMKPDGAGGDTGMQPDGAGGDTGTSPDAAPKFTFDDMFNDMFAKGCNKSGCHAASNPKAGLDLSTADKAYAGLVEVAAKGKPCAGKGWKLVVKNDATKSLFYRKLADATPPCGLRMPVGAAPLPTAMLDKVKAWIAAGAPRK